MEHVFAFLVCMFIVVVFGLFSIFAIRNMYVSQSSFLQEEAILAFRQFLESPLNETKRPPTIGIAVEGHPYVINMSAVCRLKEAVLKTERDYNANKTGLISSDDDFRIILYNGTNYIILGKNMTRSRIASVNGYAFCLHNQPSDEKCRSYYQFCPPNGNVTVQVIATGD